ncbi:hypothetical protein [Actinomadura sp. NEAU-AAG7]|uniref:hypothetical protein n=1 Tax=Actinomadura sp. NEAU-AAG7 TaxID=2839640 RepID=UPI001BE3F5DF|nr:hypothetical protein [Actinomadura sp. NEAU-AAG7]MBT2211396.1 hypothetical protein [Actinomadura sp. NEAU-AAG7]
MDEAHGDCDAPYLRPLLHALRWLGRDAEEQVAYVTAERVGVDELALMFDDVYRGAGQHLASRPADAALLEELNKIDRILAEMTEGPSALWSREAPFSAREWADLRRQSRSVIGILRRQYPWLWEPGGTNC